MLILLATFYALEMVVSPFSTDIPVGLTTILIGMFFNLGLIPLILEF